MSQKLLSTLLIFIIHLQVLAQPSWIPLPNIDTSANGEIKHLVCFNPDNVYSFGQYDDLGENINQKWNGQGWSYLPASPMFHEQVWANNKHNSNIYMSGAASISQGNNNLAINRVAQWDGQSWSMLGWDTVFSAGNDVNLISGNSGQLLAYGNSYHTQKNIICEWSGSNWNQIGNLISEDFPIPAMGGALDNNGNIFMYGQSIMGAQTTFIEHWNGNSWQSITDTIFRNGISSAIIDDNNQLIICCARISNGVRYITIAKYDGSTWTKIGNEVPMNSLGTLLVGKNNKLYCLGMPFENGNYVYHITELNENNEWVELGGNLASQLTENRKISTANVDNLGNLYVAGTFIDQPNKRYVVRYDPDGQTFIPLLNTPDDVVSITPNPSNGLFAIEMSVEVRNATISVYDASGKQVKKQTMEKFNRMNLDLSHFKKGTYFVSINGVKFYTTKKVIKN